MFVGLLEFDVSCVITENQFYQILINQSKFLVFIYLFFVCKNKKKFFNLAFLIAHIFVIF